MPNGPPRVCQAKQCNQLTVIDKTLIIVANYAITDKIIAPLLPIASAARLIANDVISKSNNTLTAVVGTNSNNVNINSTALLVLNSDCQSLLEVKIRN